MATPVRLSWMTATFTADGCDDLPAHVEPTESGNLISSAWQLDPEQHAAVAATGIVVVQCLGFQPPIQVTAPAIEQPPEARFRVSTGNFDLRAALEIAWGIIANASQGDWSQESPEWQDAAAKWRDRFINVPQDFHEVEKFTDVLTLVLHAAMKDTPEIRVTRL